MFVFLLPPRIEKGNVFNHSCLPYIQTITFERFDQETILFGI